MTSPSQQQQRFLSLGQSSTTYERKTSRQVGKLAGWQVGRLAGWLQKSTHFATETMETETKRDAVNGDRRFRRWSLLVTQRVAA